MTTYFLYARKSTDVEDKQVLSIESQLSELRSLAQREGLEIAAEFIEKQSAKTPGRPRFNEMVERIQRGEAQGVVCWKLDRLGRNPVDNGQVSWLLQQGAIQHIQTPEHSYYSKDSGLLMAVEFGMATQYVRDLAYNTRRGLRAKARRGEYPGPARVGYINNPHTKRHDVDRRKAPIVVRAFELYAEGQSRFEDIANFFSDNGIRTGSRSGSGGGKAWSKNRAKRVLTDTFYYGDFEYAGEIHHGTHTPIISKQLFDRVQAALETRGRRQKAHKDPQALCGLLRCGECGCSITAEAITKRQKNGNVHRYIYYRCTKKRGPCSQSYVREEVLNIQLSDLLSRFVLPQEWAKEMLLMADKDEREAQSVAVASVRELRATLADIDTRIARLIDIYVEQDIDRDAYLVRKRALMSERKSVEGQIARLERNATAWLQPLRDWIKDAQTLGEILKDDDLPSKKTSLQKIFGSNLTLQSREARGVAQNQWTSLCEVHQKNLVSSSVSTMVLGGRLELPRVAPLVPKTSAYTNSAIPALCLYCTKLAPISKTK
jgi:site-specific DNA recombinase